MYVRSLSKKSWNLVEVVDCAGVGAVSGFLADLGANKQREATRMTALLDRVAVHGPRQGTAKCHQIQGEIWEFIHGSLRVLFAHDGNQLILCTSGFVKKSQKTPKREIQRAERTLAEFRNARDRNLLEWVEDDQQERK